MSALSTPAFLVDEDGLLVFFNEAAGMLLGIEPGCAGEHLERPDEVQDLGAGCGQEHDAPRAHRARSRAA